MDGKANRPNRLGGIQLLGNKLPVILCICAKISTGMQLCRILNFCMPRDHRQKAARYESASKPCDHVRCSDVEPQTERPKVAISGPMTANEPENPSLALT